MRKPFFNDYPLTQAFNDPCCRASYAKFGLKGHNGQDYGLPTHSLVFSPHAGKIIEASSDPTGYGNYLKIENDKEGSVLAHLESFAVKVGDYVDEGEFIAYSDNTGNSTGAHLHWGYYLFPRDKTNGFAGFIDQAPYLQPTPPTGTINPDMPDYFKGLLQENGLDLNNEGQIRDFFQHAKDFPAMKIDLENARSEIDKLKTTVDALQKQITDLQIKITEDPSKLSTVELLNLLIKKFARILPA